MDQPDSQTPATTAAAATAPPADAPAAPPQVAVVIVGFGLPGRFVAEVLDARKVAYCILERNPSNARSIAACKKPVVCGDARDPAMLREAGLEGAQFLAVTLPDEKAVLEVLAVAKQVNPNVRMMARCNYTST